MAGNITGNFGSRLAELAALTPSSSLASASQEEEPPLREPETDAEWLARMERRAERTIRRAMEWDKEELAERYAWTLLLALEMRQTAKTKDRLAAALRRNSDIRIEAYEKAASQSAAKLKKQHLDRKRGAIAKLANGFQASRQGKSKATLAGLAGGKVGF